MNERQKKIAAELGLIVQPGSNKRKRLYLAAGAIVLVALVLLLRPGAPGTDQLFKTDTAKYADLAVTVAATGSVEPKDEVELSSELSGIMAEVYVDYNDHVSKGQPLAQLDTKTLTANVQERQSSLKSAQANVAQAQASLEEAQLQYKHYRNVWQLSDGKHPSQQTLDSARLSQTKAEASLQVAQASVDKATADLESAQSDLIKATIVSPIDGIVLSRDVEPGQTIASSYSAPTLFLLARDLKDMELHVDIDEADIGLIKVGQTATFTVDAYKRRTFAATISQIRLASTDSSTSSGVVSYKTVLTVDNRDLLLLPGMTAITDIAVRSAPHALSIASAALRYRPPQPAGQAAIKSQAKPGGLFSSFMPGGRRPHGPRPPGLGGRENSPKGTSVSGEFEPRDAVVWVLREGHPEPVHITAGINDGLRTQVIKGELREGDEVIVDAVQVKAE